jgi:hypothetical protein
LNIDVGIKLANGASQYKFFMNFFKCLAEELCLGCSNLQKWAILINALEDTILTTLLKNVTGYNMVFKIVLTVLIPFLASNSCDSTDTVPGIK